MHEVGRTSSACHVSPWVAVSFSDCIPCPTTGQGQEPPPASHQLKFNSVRDIPSKFAELSATPGVQADQALRGKTLAEAWSLLEEPLLKQAALADIRARWETKGWWEVPQGGSARKAKVIYGAYREEQDETL